MFPTNFHILYLIESRTRTILEKEEGKGKRIKEEKSERKKPERERVQK